MAATDVAAHPRADAPAEHKRSERPVLTGAQIVCQALEDAGVDTVFGYPGGAVIPLYDALPAAGFHHVLVRFEQWAAMAAQGYARATGKPGVCMTTSGPGATNLVTGLADAMLDSVPMVAITGQVIQPLIGRDAFQEVDITGITLPVTKHNYAVTRIQDLAPTIKEAFHLATSGRPGPVLIDIPKTLFQQTAEYEYPATTFRRGYQPTSVPNMRQVRLAADAIAKAKKPVIMAGHGILLANGTELFRQFVEKSGIPVAFTLLGLGTFPEDHPLGLGLMGMHGHKHVNDALDTCDLLVNIGARFDDRATGRISGFAQNARVVHVDIDPAEIGKNVHTDVPVVGDAAEVLKLLIPEIEERRYDDWTAWIDAQRDRTLSEALEDRPDWPEPYTIIKAIAKATNGEAILTTDVGQHQMWAAQHFGFNHPDRWITSGGLGTMGFGLPAAVGAKIGRPDLEVWTVIGDGGFQMSSNELATAVQENLDINICIMNNGYLGMVRQWQDLFHAKNYSEVRIGAPNFEKLAEAYGITGITVRTDAEIESAIERARSIKGPVLIDFVIEPEANVWPMVPPGGANSEMIHTRYEGKPMKTRHILSVLVENHSGVLNRVVSLLRRRSFNIESITVGHSEQPGVSRMTIVVNAEEDEVEQAGKQLYKLMEVLKVSDVTNLNCVAHELALIKVAAKSQTRAEILQIAQIYDARVVDASPSTLLLEASGPEDRVDGLLNMLKAFGIRELVRTGPVAMQRGSASVGVKEMTRPEREMAVAGNGTGPHVN